MIDWREELKKMEQEKAILDKAFEEGNLCYYREPWESWEEEYSPEELEEVLPELWEDENDQEDDQEEELPGGWTHDIDEKFQDLYWATVVRW